MKLTEILIELGFKYDDGLWVGIGNDDSLVYATEIDEGVQVIKMPTDTDQPTTVVRYNRIDVTLHHLLEHWTKK